MNIQKKYEDIREHWLKNSKLFLILPLLLLAMSIFRCGKNKPDSAEVVARVDDAYLTRETVNSMIPEKIDDENRKSLVKSLIEKWVDQQVMAKTAQNEGIELTPHDEWQIEGVQSEIYATKLISKKIPNDFNITDKEIEDYYQANQKLFERENDEVHIAHLYLEKLDKAITTEIKQSNSLNNVIEKNFLDRQINRVIEPNGDLGYVEVDKLRPEFKRAIRGTKTGIIYGPIRAGEGYHYLQVLDRKPANSVRRLELVRDEITNLLKIEKRQSMIKKYKESLKNDFSIETFLSNIE